jgi:cytoskeletal protein RodZ
MDELGHILREARETKGLTLSDVQAQIRISSRYLEALESGEYGVLPTPVHVRGFLRNYARFLGLDPQPLLDRFENKWGSPVPTVVRGSRETIPETLLPPRQDQPFFDPVNVDVEDGRRRDPESLLRLIIIVALIVSLVLVGNRFIPLLLGNVDGTEALTEGFGEILRNLGGADSPTETDDSASLATVTAGEIITSTSRNIIDDAPSTPFPTRPPLPATMESIPLKLEITERTWMEVTIDGDVVFTGIALPSDPPYEWEAQEEAKVVTGNAIGIFVTIGDIPLGRLGGRGENMEEIWQTTN